MKADSDLVRRQNRGLLLSLLRDGRSQARIELGRRTGLSPATITAITADLIAEGLVREAEIVAHTATAARRGRPLVRLSLDARAAHVLAIRISVDELEFALADYGGGIRRRALVSLPTFTATAAAFSARLVEETAAFLADAGLAPGDIAHCGLATQGLADSSSGEIAWSPAMSARDVPLAEPLRAALGLVCTVSNDVNMIAEGLLAADPHRYGGTTAVVFLGYGVGMGLIIGGKVYSAPTGAGSEFGHMNHRPEGPKCRCGRMGCVEAYAADYGLLRTASGVSSNDEPAHSAIPEADMEALEHRAAAGDARALAAFALSGEALGYGIARLMAIVGPRRIVFAGPGARHYPMLEPVIRRSLEAGVVDVLRKNLVMEVVTLAKDAVIRGTVATALRRLDQDVFAAQQRLPLRAAG